MGLSLVSLTSLQTPFTLTATPTPTVTYTNLDHYTIYAPWPDSCRVMVLPVPEFGNAQRNTSVVNVGRAINGTTYTTTINKPGYLYRWTFDITRRKFLELFNFYTSYSHQQWKIVANEGDLIGHIKNNPFSGAMARRSVISDSVEAVTLEIEFQT